MQQSLLTVYNIISNNCNTNCYAGIIIEIPKVGHFMVELTVDEYLKKISGANKENIKTLKESLNDTLQAKRNGATCQICGEPIWAAGSAIVGWHGCFSCITGEVDSSEDFEIC